MALLHLLWMSALFQLILFAMGGGVAPKPPEGEEMYRTKQVSAAAPARAPVAPIAGDAVCKTESNTISTDVLPDPVVIDYEEYINKPTPARKGKGSSADFVQARFDVVPASNQ